MQTLSGNRIKLRALEPEDLDFLFASENDEENWEISNTQVPFSKYILKLYIENSHLDIYEAKQLRLVIADLETNKPLGMIDLFDFEPFHHKAGLGIIINKEVRKKDIATEALQLLIPYAFKHLNLHQLYANITTDNQQSIRLFEKFNFTLAGIKKDWIYSSPNYKDEAIYQLILENNRI
jgi:diamine N-acetyltransferase